jgi:hypothetical protein
MIVTMYFRPASEPIQFRGGWPVAAAASTCVGLTLLLGIVPKPFSDAAHRAAVAALDHPNPAPLEEPVPQNETASAADALAPIAGTAFPALGD